MNRKSWFALIMSTLLGMFLPSLASALGTPDELPPPMEHVCDAENGAAYGLCNAYCQAMDCDNDTPSASDTACQKVSDKFMQLTGRSVPCSIDCPLYQNPAFPFFNGLVSNPSSIDSCTDGWLGDSKNLIVCSGSMVCDPVSPTFGAVWYSGRLPYGGDNDESVRLDNDDPNDPDPDPVEFNSCRGLLEDAVALSGVTCD